MLCPNCSYESTSNIICDNDYQTQYCDNCQSEWYLDINGNIILGHCNQSSEEEFN